MYELWDRVTGDPMGMFLTYADAEAERQQQAPHQDDFVIIEVDDLDAA